VALKNKSNEKDELGTVVISQDLDFRIKKLDKDAPYESNLLLKVGAQVMLLTNMDPELGLVNGSRGVVKELTDNGPVVEFMGLEKPKLIKAHIWKLDGDEPIGREQIPLRLGYALTIHKAQGASLDSAMVDIGEATFECGQAYVALSRVRSLEALYVYQIDKGAFRVHPSVKAFYSGLDTIVSPPSKIGTDSVTEDSE
jgi:ATP-dependent DNA helicase PIF1